MFRVLYFIVRSEYELSASIAIFNLAMIFRVSSNKDISLVFSKQAAIHAANHRGWEE